MESVCKAKRGDIPKYPRDKFQEIIWKLIEPLCLDHTGSYTVRDVSKDDPRVHDYLDLGINSPRGRAVETALEYARWVANHKKECEGKKETVPGGFDSMPEVRRLLKEQIAPANKCVVVMSVIGTRIGLIYWIDKNWLKDNTEKIFSLKGIEETPPKVEGWAAWNAFIVWNRPHIEFYRLFRSQFAYAVEQAARVKEVKDGSAQPMYHLGEYLMLLYGWGKKRGQLEMEDDAILLKSFLKTANPKIRRHAIGFVGESLEGEEVLPEEIIERFVKMYDEYWQNTGKKDAEEGPEAQLFGTWFASGKFPEKWALDQLGKLVEVVPTPEPNHRIIEKLANIAHIDIEKSVRILDLMVRGDKEGWHVHGWLDKAKEILEQAMQETGEACEKAEELINYLGRRGYYDVGKLLNKKYET